uniref:DUF7255 family protein n=1 Tax=Nocardia fluminea TaxID=134984 RepID=UPI001FE2D984|nr:hypothetical protein [Nocardia fluminea]
MVRTGRRAAALQHMLIKAGLHPAPLPPPPRLAQLSGDAQAAIEAVYQALGGSAPMLRLRPGSWDLAFADGLVIELDEELHFNRYRAQTLHSLAAAALPWHEDYLWYSSRYEQNCLAAGKWERRWSTTRCETMFGPPGPPGVLVGRRLASMETTRALRRCQRHRCDALDHAVRLARLSIWDSVGGMPLGDGLYEKAQIDPAQVAAILARRTSTSA